MKRISQTRRLMRKFVEDDADLRSGHMFGLGATELVIILLIIVIIFGASRLPQLGKGLGLGIKNFKESIKQEEKSVEEHTEKKSA